jgi:hypothetical protein
MGLPFLFTYPLQRHLGLCPQCLKIRFLKEINEYRQSILCLTAVIVLIEMIPVKKLNLLHNNMVIITERKVMIMLVFA